ncbi:MAG: efflux RND transporter periplasmic adaptor subunit [Deltaproteobacteria bacterium]|nr:efflux RND transporter periplasmic adaptor subunit [Deltaproteobacteria bacterium]
MPAAKPITAAPAEFVGIVTSRNSKVITADFEGRVDRLDLFNGKHVKAGQVVAHLDDSELQNRLRAARAKKASAQAQAAKAGAIYANAARKAKVERYLSRSGASSPEALRSAQSDQAAAGAEGGVAESDIKAANADIDEVQRLLANADVKAPIDGVVAVVKTKEGELAHKGTAIARVFDPESLVIRFGVPHANLATVTLNTPVVLTTEDGTQIPATIQRQDDDHDPTIDLTTFEAAIDPTIRIDGIRVGEYGHVRIAAAPTAAQGAAR